MRYKGRRPPKFTESQRDEIKRIALAAHNIELAYVSFNASWLNRIEAQFTGLRYFALDGTDHSTHKEQGRAIRRYLA